MVGNIGLGEMVVIVAVALIVFGPDRLPGMMRQAGKAFRAFQGESQRAMAELRDAVDTSDLQTEFEQSVVMDRPDQWAAPESKPAPPSRKPAARKPVAKKAAAKKPAAKKPAAKKAAAKKSASKKPAAKKAATPSIPAAYPSTEDT